jgi:hypothetical protein
MRERLVFSSAPRQAGTPKGKKIMFSRKLTGGSLALLAAAGAMLLVAATAQAAISPIPAGLMRRPRGFDIP